MAATGDIRNNIFKAQSDLRSIQYNVQLDLVRLAHGDPTSFLPLIHYILLDASAQLASYISERGHDLYGKRDTRFIEAVYKLLRDEFNYRPTLTKNQFFSMGFAERKLIFISDLIRLCRGLCSKNSITFPGARFGAKTQPMQQQPQQPLESRFGFSEKKSASTSPLPMPMPPIARRAQSVSPHPQPIHHQFSRSYNAEAASAAWGTYKVERNFDGSGSSPKRVTDPPLRKQLQQKTSKNVIHTTIGGVPVKINTEEPQPVSSIQEDFSVTKPSPAQLPLRSILDPSNNNIPTYEKPSYIRGAEEDINSENDERLAAKDLDSESIGNPNSTRLIATSIWSQQVAHSTGTFRTLPPPPTTHQQQQPRLQPHHLYYPGLSDFAGNESDPAVISPNHQRDGEGYVEIPDQVEDDSFPNNGLPNDAEVSCQMDESIDNSILHEPSAPPAPMPRPDKLPSSTFGGSIFVPKVEAFEDARQSSHLGFSKPLDSPVGEDAEQSMSRSVLKNSHYVGSLDLDLRSKGKASIDSKPKDSPLPLASSTNVQIKAERKLPFEEGSIASSNNRPIGVPPLPSARRFNSLYEMRMEQVRQAIHDAKEPVRYSEAHHQTVAGPGSVGAFKDIGGVEVSSGRPGLPVSEAVPLERTASWQLEQQQVDVVANEYVAPPSPGWEVGNDELQVDKNGQGEGDEDVNRRLRVLEVTVQKLVDGNERVKQDLSLLCNSMSTLEKAVYSALESLKPTSYQPSPTQATISSQISKPTQPTFVAQNKDTSQNEEKPVAGSSGIRTDYSTKTTDEIIRSLEERMQRTSILLQEKANVAKTNNLFI
ncbi:Centrosomal protein of 44 kDa [Phlyctochytrium planicorne]|nr:Centrosomal protein of 44 kDa [Phlyctochytrium planicorne]